MYCIVELAFGHNRATGEALPAHCIALAEHQVLTFFAQCFGGGQRYHTIGSYRTADHRLMIEGSTILRAYTNEVKEYWDDLHQLARAIACSLEQACVLVSVIHVDGSLVLVKPELQEIMK